MINNSFSIPLSTLEAENYMPAMHAKSEPKISVCLLEKKVYGQIQSFHWKFNEKTGFIGCFLKKVLHKREEKMQEKLKMT